MLSVEYNQIVNYRHKKMFCRNHALSSSQCPRGSVFAVSRRWSESRQERAWDHTKRQRLIHCPIRNGQILPVPNRSPRTSGMDESGLECRFGSVSGRQCRHIQNKPRFYKTKPTWNMQIWLKAKQGAFLQCRINFLYDNDKSLGFLSQITVICPGAQLCRKENLLFTGSASSSLGTSLLISTYRLSSMLDSETVETVDGWWQLCYFWEEGDLCSGGR